MRQRLKCWVLIDCILFIEKRRGIKKTGKPVFFGDRRRIRTFDRLLRRQVLYPAELCDRVVRVSRSLRMLFRARCARELMFTFCSLGGLAPLATYCSLRSRPLGSSGARSARPCQTEVWTSGLLPAVVILRWG